MDKWDARFMELAEVISGWASCYQPDRKIGAVIVKNKRIVTTGYNGAPAGIKTCVERGECLRKKLGIPSGTRHEMCYAVHAEQNAIIHAARNDMIGSTLYLVGKEYSTGEYIKNANPCSLCKRFIINAGIETVVIRDDSENYRVIDVQSEYVDKDESLEGILGY